MLGRVIVGTILIAINYGDRIYAQSVTGTDFLKMTLTYLVPYCVSTWSAVEALRKKQ